MKELKNLDETPPEGIKVGVNDDNFSIIYADIEGPGTCLWPSVFSSDSISLFMIVIWSLQLEHHMKMAFFGWSWYCLMISRNLLQKVCDLQHLYIDATLILDHFKCIYLLICIITFLWVSILTMNELIMYRSLLGSVYELWMNDHVSFLIFLSQLYCDNR